MKIRRLGIIEEKFGSVDEYVFSGNLTGDIVGKLTSIPFPSEESINVSFPLIIDSGVSARLVTITIPIPMHFWKKQLIEPILISPFDAVKGKYIGLYLFCNCIFQAISDYVSFESEEIGRLRIKRFVFSEKNEILQLRKEVAALERISDQTEYARKAIPDLVKLVVFERDRGQCVHCGAKEKLHFDHIIPVAKGGGDTEENIQLLCSLCNLKKSDKLSF